MPEAFKGCLSSISNLSDIALEERISTTGKLLDTIRPEETTVTGARKRALSGVINYLGLLFDQARDEQRNRELQQELERDRQILAELASAPQENDKNSDRLCDRDRLQKDIEDTERLIHSRRSARDAVEGQLSALSSIQIDSYLDVAGIPAHDPLRLALNGQGNDLSKASESSTEPSPAQSFKTFAAETFIDLIAKYPGRSGVPAEALVPFATECNTRGYMLNSDFLGDTVCKAIKDYNGDHPQAEIKNFSDLVAVLKRSPIGTGSVKKKKKNSKQEVTRKFRVWLSDNKGDYLKKLEKEFK
jgi:hypothetical protein